MTNTEPKPIYLDANAATPMDERVFEAMRPFFVEKFGNSTSKTHSYGWDSDIAVETARKQVATLINCAPKEVFFTGCGTESNNIAISGVINCYLRQNPNKKPHFITSELEHKSVLATAEYLETKNVSITYLSPDKYGRISPEDLKKAIRPETILVSIMAANNEIGTLQEISEFGEICRDKNIYFHTDAAQIMGYQKIDVQKIKVDLLSFVGQKMYGPKGVSALYVRQLPQRVQLDPIMFGGGHEKSLRPGTLNTPAIVGLGKACEIVMQESHFYSERIQGLRDDLLLDLLKIPFIKLNGHPLQRLCNNISITVDGISNSNLIKELKALAISTGSACSSENPTPSHVLKSIGLSDQDCLSTIRIGLTKYTSPEETKMAAELIKSAATRLKNRSF